MGENDIRYLKCLAKRYPTIAETATEIINLQSILSLPKEQSILLPISTENMTSSSILLKMHLVRLNVR